MKKLLYVAMATTLALSSCSENEIMSVEKMAKTPISIDVYSQAETRATLNDLNTLKNSGFTIAAVSGTTKLIDNASASFDATADAWSYGTTANWPDNISSKVNFYGLYSAATATLDALNGQATITVDGDNDVLAATISNSLEETSNGNVTLSFAHIMSQVVVSVKGGDARYTAYNISNVKITTDNSVIYTYSSNETAAATGATKIDLPYYNPTAGSNGLSIEYAEVDYTPIDDTKALILPAVNCTISITYSANTSTGYGSGSITKSADFTPVAGCVNRVCLSLPVEVNPVAFTIDQVAPWGDPNVLDDLSWK